MTKRRPSGDGMVRKREDGRWEGRIVVGHKENGDSIFRYVYANTQIGGPVAGEEGRDHSAQDAGPSTVRQRLKLILNHAGVKKIRFPNIFRYCLFADYDKRRGISICCGCLSKARQSSERIVSLCPWATYQYGK